MRAFAIRCGLLVFVLLLVVSGPGAAVSALRPRQAISAGEFWQRVDQTLATLGGLKSKPDDEVKQTLDRLAEQWAAVDGVTLADGSTSPLETGAIVAALRRRPYDLASLTRLFKSLQDAHGIQPTRASSPGDLAALQTILQRPEFQWDRPPSPLEEWWNSLKKRISDWWNSLFGNNNISIPVPADVFTVFASILLALILLYIFRGLFADLILETRLDEEHAAGDELLTAETALQKAKDISRAGDYRTAVRYLYLSSLLLLDERGLLRFDRSKTNREYLRSVSAFPEFSAPLRDVIDVFDRVWYGFQPLDQDDFQHYVEKVDQLREQK